MSNKLTVTILVGLNLILLAGCSHYEDMTARMENQQVRLLKVMNDMDKRDDVHRSDTSALLKETVNNVFDLLNKEMTSPDQNNGVTFNCDNGLKFESTYNKTDENETDTRSVSCL